MKNLGEYPSKRIFKKKGTKWILISICILGGIGGTIFYQFQHKQAIYNSIHLVLGSNKSVEYGTSQYNPLDLVKKSTGNVRVVSSEIDTNKIGEGKVVFEIEKDSVTKQIEVNVNVRDTTPPEIVLKEERVSVYVGDGYNILEAIASVRDVVDGDLPFVEKEEGNENTAHYIVENSTDFNKVGEYPVTVKAMDKAGNKKEATFIIEVKNRPTLYSNKAPSGDMNALSNIAHSLLGSPYVAGGNNPSGFDCSGFVSYVYAKIGISIPRTTSGQLTAGVRVARENLTVGDILVWSNGGAYPTHTGVYIGNGNMIHAANPRKGVIISSVSAWPEVLLSIRRI